MAGIDELRQAGFSDEEIAANKAPELREAGFTDPEIEQHLAGLRNPRQIPQPLLDRFMAGAGRMGSAVAEGFGAGFGDEPVGIKPEDAAKLSDVGIFRKPGQPYQGIPGLQLANEALMRPAVTAVEAMFRGVNGALMGLGAGIGQAVAEVTGADETQSAKARRDMAQLVAITALLAGAHSPMGRRGPGGDEMIGHLPRAQDFTDAARAVTPDGGDLAAARAKLATLYEDHGLHPSEVAHDVTTDPGKAAAFDAYHGSPHDFEAFSLDKIGTGEGAQSYGHGLYFAENPKVSESYLMAGKSGADTGTAEVYARAALRDGQTSADLRKEADVERTKGTVRGDFEAKHYDRAADMIDSGEIKPPILYTVRVNADREHFLDWDRPLSEQAPSVQTAAGNAWKEAGMDGSVPLTHTGQNLINDLQRVGKDEASRMLNDAGIHGIKYLDQGSRTAGDGSRNFVLFDDKLIEITHKNGVAIGPAPDATQITPIRGSKVDERAIKAIMDTTGVGRDEAARVVQSVPRSERARTGIPNIDAILDNPITKRNIDNPLIDRSHDVPYGAGGSVPLEDPTVYIDRHIPRAITVDGVTFDPAEPFTIHENVEQHVMEELIAGGMDKQTAYKVAHFEYAEKAEGAWYKAHGIDQAKAEAAYKPMLDAIQHDDPKNPPSNLYDKPYPHDDEAMAQAEPLGEPKPSKGEVGRADAIMSRTRKALDPDGIPANQQLATVAAGGPPVTGGGGGGFGSPPARGFAAPGAPPPPPGRAPYFRYDDRNGFVKAFDQLIKGWQKTFQPELVSDKALQAEPFFAETKSRQSNKRDQTIANSEAGHQYWRGQSEVARLDFIDNFERGRTMADPIEEGHADIYRQMFDRAYDLEKTAGSKADYFAEYFPHLWQDPLQASEWVQSRKSQLGPTWFQKERTFSAIREGMAEGLRLKSSNPEDLVTMRVLASADMLERMNLLQNMRAMDLAVPHAEYRPGMWDAGFREIIGPDRETWHIAPDIQPLWDNAMKAKGFWANEGMPGTIFRGWMALKNVWVPLKLALSAFHPLHVLHINYTEGMARAWGQLREGDPVAALRSVGEGFGGPLQALAPETFGHPGAAARVAWLKPEDARTPTERALVDLMHDGGFVPMLSEELRIAGQRSLEKAWDNSEWFKVLPLGMRRAIEVVQAPVFQEWIPNLKAAAYLQDAQALLTRRPDLLDDPIQRRAALRTIGKSIDNRYGEMFYGGVFWNRYVKDAGIGSFLSLGWNLGFARDAGGALLGPVARTVRSLARGAATETEATIREAQNKATYWIAYATSAMAINGLMTYGFSGQTPEGMDWFLPRVGRNNPDGTPHRITNMFYTREIPMAMKHVEEHGGGVGGTLTGVGDMLWSKLMFQPIKEMIDNRGYYGADIWDENGPVYRQAGQALAHLFGEQFNPMSVSGARRSLDTGGGMAEAAGAFLGFGPAPGYAEKTAMQNRIAGLFARHGEPYSRPREEGEKSKTRGDIRNEILLAKQRGDSAAVEEGAQKWFKAGGSRQGLSNMMLGLGGDVSMFRALPESDQKAIMDQASAAERARYQPYLKSNVSGKVADLMVDAQKARQAGQSTTAAMIDQQVEQTIANGIQEGHIGNADAFRRSLQQQLLARHAPELSAILALPRGQRGQYMQPAQQGAQ